MADDLPGLLFPAAVGRMDREFPRRDQPPPRQRRQPPPRRQPDGHETVEPLPETDDGPVVGGHLDVRA
jgi:hypothetical protein